MRTFIMWFVSVSLGAACGGGSPTEGGGGGGSGGGGGGGGGPVATTSVNLRGSAFIPPSIRVSPGAVVTWTNSDGIAHNVTFAETSVTDVPDWTSGTRTATMPATVGTYQYSCTNHSGMAGSVQVQ